MHLVLRHFNLRFSKVSDFVAKSLASCFDINFNEVDDSLQDVVALLIDKLVVQIFDRVVLHDNDAVSGHIHDLFESIFENAVLSDLLASVRIIVKS